MPSPPGVKKLRIYEVAKDLGMSSEVIQQIAKKLGVEVKNHMSTLPPDIVEKVRSELGKEKAAAREVVVRQQEHEAQRAREERQRAHAAQQAAAQAAQQQAQARAATPITPHPSVPPTAGAAVVFRPPTPTLPTRTYSPPAGTPRPSGPRPGGPTGGSRPGAPGSRPSGPPRSGGFTGPPGGRPTHGGFGAPGGGPRPSFGPPGPSRGRRDRKKKKQVDEKLAAESVRRTLASLDVTQGRRKHHRREDESGAPTEAAKVLRTPEFITVSELANMMQVRPQEVITACMRMGLMATINKRLDKDSIAAVADEFGFEVEFVSEFVEEVAEATEVVPAERLRSRAPVVTVMGHVDHGKTSLLDFIRKANVVAGEAGGITQHIGAYNVKLPDGRHITFLDTPGHEAFTAMRARGAQVTDIVVLVVAADDGIMPQTIEAISHAKNADVPIVVAVNKVDLPQANPDRVKQELLQHGVVLEQFGGQVLSAEISAKKGTNVQQLLDAILLQAEIEDLKSNPDRRAVGTVIEAQLDAGKGPLATVLVQKGTLRVGDDFIVGLYSGRVRALLDERGKAVKEAGPAIPVQVLGMEGVPQAGDEILVVEDASQSREIAQRRQRLDREAKSRRTSRGGVSLEDFMSQAAAGGTRTLNILIKADQGGPAEALADALGRLSTDEVKVEVVHRGVGAITESDILLAKASGAIIIGFHVRPDNNARSAAEREGVDIRLYRIIYEAVNDVRAALEGLLRPEQREVILGEAEVRETFKVSRVGVIAGCSVRSGVINRQGRVRVIRDAVEVYDGTIASLRRFKEDVREVREGFECGIGIENFNDVKIGDVIECYRTEQVARTLEASS